MRVKRKITAPNGVKYELNNKSVSITADERDQDGGVVIQFAVADGDNTPRSVHYHRLGVSYTTIRLSKESAACLADGLIYLFQTKFNQSPLP